MTDDSIEDAYDSLAAALRVKQEFQQVLIDGIGCLPGEHLDEFAERIVREWRTKEDWKRRYQAAESSRRDWAAEAMRLETENERLREALPTYLKLLDLAEASIAGVVMDTDEDKSLQGRVLSTMREGKERISAVSRPVCTVHEEGQYLRDRPEELGAP